MASCQTTRWVSTSPYVKLTVTQSASTDTTVTLSYTLQYISDYKANTNGVGRPYTVKIAGATVANSTFNINGKTGTHTIATGTKVINKTTAAQNIAFSVSFAFNLTWSGSYKGTLTASGTIPVAAKTSYTVKYNANGGSGAPSSQTKWYGTALTLSSTKPTRTGYTFQGWATSSGGSVAYAAGESYTVNAAVTLYAVWKANTYTVKYNANGGSGAPSNQTKTYGVALTLSSTKPTRTNYTFKGWGTSASSTTISYASGASYTANAAITLYAIWELSYVKPRINAFSVSRCTSNKTISDSGTYALVTFTWACDQTISQIKIEWENSAGSASSKTVSASGTSGSVSELIGAGALSPESTYIIRVTVKDASDQSVVISTLNGTKFVIDFKAGGKGAAFGKPAEIDNLLDIAFQTRMLGGIMPPVLEPDTDLDNVQTPNTYIGANISSNNYGHCPVTSGTFTLLVESCGEAGQVKQTYVSCSKYKPERFVRFYYQGEWDDWLWASTDEYVLYESTSGGSTGTITLSASASHYRYIEIYYTDNNGQYGGYTKVWNPNGKSVNLQIQEASSQIYSRQTRYTISGTSMTPELTTASYVRFQGTTLTTSMGTNYIKIVRVIGRA